MTQEVEIGRLKGKRVLVKALGCRTNLYEAEAIASAFESCGATLIDEGLWDVAVLLSCSVTAQADRKCRQMVRRFRRFNPEGLVVAVGCWAQGLSEGDREDLRLDLVVGNRKKDQVVPLVDGLLSQGSVHVVRENVMKDGHWESLSLDRPRLRTRAFLKVQDGCDHFCSYCIIPFLRGKPVSRPWEDLKEEILSVVDSGCPEVVLTGIHLGLYGRDGGPSLAELIERVGAIPGVLRIRLGSLEPFSIGDDLLASMRDVPQFCHHLHLPLQSGDDRILDAMRRGHTSSDYLRLLDRLRDALGEDVHISTDVLVGFPGEDDRAFKNTLQTLKDGAIGRVHGFPFSPREGTLAKSMADRPPRSVAEDRCREVIALGEELLEIYSKRWIGRELPVMLEERSDGYVTGYTPHFLKVKASGEGYTSSIVKVRIASLLDGDLKGEVLS
nr:tRNA (N(6)-L-threonylcarbamoyladenosine(37)-C(2))-methylthiotransferase MtaB [uncultured Dethiosulfovibrio sp.]